MTIKIMREDPPTQPPIQAIRVDCCYNAEDYLGVDGASSKDGVRFHVGNRYMRMSWDDFGKFVEALKEIQGQRKTV